jgi:hypothetical protein
MEAKSILKSKTFWTNLIVAGVYPFLPEAAKNPTYIVYFLIVANVALRKISHGKVELV